MLGAGVGRFGWSEADWEEDLSALAQTQLARPPSVVIP